MGETQRRAGRGVRFSVLNVATMVAALVLVVALLFTSYLINSESDALADANDRYFSCEAAANDLMDASSYLTTQSRLFSTTNHVAYVDNYFWEMGRGQRRQNDVAVLEELCPGTDAARYLEQAREFSDKLAKNELYSMKLVKTALDLDLDDDIALQLDAIAFRREDASLSADDMLAKARELVTYEPYEHEVDRIAKQVDMCKDELAAMREAETAQHTAALDNLLTWQQVLMVALLAIVLITAIMFIFTVFLPINDYIASIRANEKIKEKGSSELRFLAHAYNALHDENSRTHTKLTHEAEHDPLTGLCNRGAFDKRAAEVCTGPNALVLVDIDYFKQVNDEHGHDCGDRVLKRVASLLEGAFRSTDCCCRIGGDEFAVIMVDLPSDQREVIVRKVRGIAEVLAAAEGDVPAVGISAGAAFGDGSQSPDDMYKRADEALYRVKDAGRRAIAFADEADTRPFE